MGSAVYHPTAGREGDSVAQMDVLSLHCTEGELVVLFFHGTTTPTSSRSQRETDSEGEKERERISQVRERETDREGE